MTILPNNKIERRAFTTEVRADGDSPKITGYAAVFNSQSEEMWGFREIITPGAFADAIKVSDVRALWNHNPDYVLGRSAAGTLALREDERGLFVEIDPPNTQWARDLLESIRRGDVNQMSFAFVVAPEGVEWRETPDGLLRVIKKFDRLYDVSPVTYPAYPATEVGVRSAAEIIAEYKQSVQAPGQWPSVDIRLKELKLKEVM